MDEQQQLINDPSHLQDSQTDAGNIEQEYKDAVEAAVADKKLSENLEKPAGIADEQAGGGSAADVMSRQPGFWLCPARRQNGSRRYSNNSHC